jgi:hypothetical protein
VRPPFWFFCQRIAVSGAPGQHFHIQIMAFLPELTEKPRSTATGLTEG